MVTDGGPQADFMGERESSEFKQNLNGCPQADDGKKCESSEFKRNLNGCPQADGGGEQVSINDERLFTHNIFSAVFIKLRKCLMTDD